LTRSLSWTLRALSLLFNLQSAGPVVRRRSATGRRQPLCPHWTHHFPKVFSWTLTLIVRKVSQTSCDGTPPVMAEPGDGTYQDCSSTAISCTSHEHNLGYEGADTGLEFFAAAG
jgi:hypothetical protein